MAARKSAALTAENEWCTVGWVDIGTGTRVWRRLVGFHEKVWKTAEKCFGQQIF
jgi:hypothetical protein